MKRGPKGTSINKKKLAGTERPDRKVIELFSNTGPLDPAAAYSEPDMPPGMRKEAEKIWERKLKRYRERGQIVRGCEDALKQYCEIEHDIALLRRKSKPVPIAMIREHRTYAAEFYDTPASRKSPVVAPQSKENPFLKNMNRKNAVQP